MEHTMEAEGHDAGGGGGQTGILSLDTKSVKPYASQDEYLYAMKEDLAEWFNTLYGHSMVVDNFFEQLETGVVMCQHANNVQSFIKEQMELLKKNKGATPKRPAVSLPDRPVQYRSNVKAGSFQSRDNVSNFIAWCKALGINNVILFETEDLVLRKNEKHVVLCLLEVARRGAQYGMLAPTLVQMEREIDAEIAGQEPEPVPHVQRKTCDLMSLDEMAKPKPKKAKKTKFKISDIDTLDRMVREMVSRCTCPDQFPMVKVSDGKYRIGDSQTLIFVRILRNHVMVRIGGGWDTLQNYLDRHDPCQCPSKGHKGRVGGTTPSKATTRRQSAPATQLVGLEQRMRTNTPSADNAKNQKTSEPRASTPNKQPPATRSKRSHSLAPIVCGEPQQWKPPQKNTSVNRSFDPSVLPGMRSPSPASSETSQASTTKRSGVVSMSRDSGISSRREADSASDASSSCGSPGLHKRFNSANDVSFPKELTLSAVDEDTMPRQRPTSARERVRRATATSSIPTTKKSSNITNNNNTKEKAGSRGRQKQRDQGLYAPPDRHARSRSVEPMELTNDRYARKTNNMKKSAETPLKKKKQDAAGEVLIISRDSAGRHRLGPQPTLPQTNGDSSDLDGYPSGGSRHSSTSSSMSGLSCGPTNGYSNGHSSSGEEKRPGTPRVNISPDRILPDKPKLMSRSHTADLGHLGEKAVVPGGGDTDTDTDTESRTHTATRMSVSSNQSSTLSLASSFDDYPEPPPEDRNLNAEMERLFEEYRRQEMKTKKKSSTPSRHRRSNSADLLEMSDASFDRQRINNAFQKARSSSRDMLDSSSSRVRSRRSSNVSVDSNQSATNTRQVVSSSSTPRRTGVITPTPTRTSSLRGTLGMARELRNKLNEQSMSGTRATPIRSSSMNTHRPTTPLSTNPRGNANSSYSSTARGRSQSREPQKSSEEYRAGSRASSRASSRPSSRASSRNVSRDSSLTRMRPSSAMSHREQQERMSTPRLPASARPTPSPSANGRPRSNSTNNLYPEAKDTCSTILSPEGLLTCQTNLLDKDPELHTPKPRKDKREGRTRIPMPVDMLANAKYDTDDQPLRRYDSGVDINNMSPTESSVHGDDNWQQELLLQPEDGDPHFATPSLGYNVPIGSRTNGQASFDDMY